jgi:hypothetical protein
VFYTVSMPQTPQTYCKREAIRHGAGCRNRRAVGPAERAISEEATFHAPRIKRKLQKEEKSEKDEERRPSTALFGETPAMSIIVQLLVAALVVTSAPGIGRAIKMNDGVTYPPAVPYAVWR